VVYAWGAIANHRSVIHGINERGTLYINFNTGQAFTYKHTLNWDKIIIPAAFLFLCFICIHLIFPRRIFYHLWENFLIFRYFKYSYLDLVMIGIYGVTNVVMFTLFYDPRKDKGVNFAVLIELSLTLLFATVVKSPVFSRIFKTTYEKQIKYHRFLSWMTVAAVVVHMLATLGNFAVLGTLSKEVKWEKNIYGIISGAIMLSATFMTLRFIRRETWEFFKFAHFALIAFLLFGALHNIRVLYFCLPGISLYLLDRIYRLIRKVYRKASIEEINTQHPGLTVLKLRINKFKYHPGQFLLITIPDVSVVQSHPFTIASSPLEELVTIHLKSLGNWSQEIRKLTTQSRIWVDGPYGVKPSWRKYEVIVLFSGGIGATPWISIIRDFILRKDAKRKPKQIYFHGCFRSKADVNNFEDTWALAQHNPSVSISKYITQIEDEVCCSSETDSEDRWEDEEMEDFTKPKDMSLKYGRPYVEGIFSDISLKHSQVKEVLVMVCGPGAMARAVQKECYYHSKYSGTVFRFHTETFKL